MYKVIMAPTDGSDVGRMALLVAVKLARRFRAELRIVRVATTPVLLETIAGHAAVEATEHALREERLARLRELEALAEECRALGEVRVVTALEEGPIAPTLRDHAEKHKVGLIVMSSHSRGGVQRLTLGSVTDYLIRMTNIPVLVVRPSAPFLGAAPGSMFSRIVVPLDGSALAEQILPEVATLALRLGAAVSLLHVLTPVTYSQEQMMQPGLPWWDNDIAMADAYLTRAASYLAEKGLSVSKEVVLDDAIAPSILEYAERTKADLIAIATSGNGGMRRFVFGTAADEVTRTSPIHILVFHPKEGATKEVTRLRSEAEAMVGT